MKSVVTRAENAKTKNIFATFSGINGIYNSKFDFSITFYQDDNVLLKEKFKEDNIYALHKVPKLLEFINNINDDIIVKFSNYTVYLSSREMAESFAAQFTY
jgi:hypothetical protein